MPNLAPRFPSPIASPLRWLATFPLRVLLLVIVAVTLIVAVPIVFLFSDLDGNDD